MKKNQKAERLHVRVSVAQQQELESFVNRWEEVAGLNIKKSEVIRNALKTYLGHYNVDTIWHQGNTYIGHFDQDKYKFEALFNLLYEFQERIKIEEDESTKYLITQLKDILTSVLGYEKNEYQMKGAEYKFNHNLGINKRESQ